MNDREKRLLIALGTALFAVVTLYGFKTITAKKSAVEAEIRGLETRLDGLIMLDRTREAMMDDVTWLEENQPEPKEGELAPSKLENLVTQAATQAGLSVNRPKILPNIEDVGFYDRARFQVSVSGQETGLYRWLVQMHSPKDFRAVTSIRLSPNREDDTKIDVVATIEEWFTPKEAPEEQQPEVTAEGP